LQPDEREALREAACDRLFFLFRLETSFLIGCLALLPVGAVWSVPMPAAEGCAVGGGRVKVLVTGVLRWYMDLQFAGLSSLNLQTLNPDNEPLSL
jgi:hypothetical protein